MASKFRFIIIVFALFLLLSCGRGRESQIAREDLFKLGIGRMENQIALYQLDGSRGEEALDITMRDGLFYVSDMNGQKIQRFNSYGDLLFMIYNEETNPEPLSLKPNIEDSSKVTRWAFPYPLNMPGRIAVDKRKHIYAEDRLSRDRFSIDVESGALLDSHILHFDNDGRFIEYLGQEGVGGTPFPRIFGLYTTVDNEAAVVCRLPSGWNVYWFNARGERRYLVQIKNEAVPIPPDWPELVPALENIAVAPDSRRLYVKVDYYRDTFDESTNTRTGNELASSYVWVMDMESGTYTDTVEIPFYDSPGERLLYTMLGAAKDGNLFFMLPVETGYSVLILDSGHTETQRHGLINVAGDELVFNTFDLSEDGILSALLVDDWNVKVVWWRTDQIMRHEEDDR